MVRDNSHSGGANTNRNGLLFERESSLFQTLKDEGYFLKYDATDTHEKHKVSVFPSDPDKDENAKPVAYLIEKYRLYHYLDEKGIKWGSLISKKYLPDEALLNIKNKTLFIIEKKFQNSSGSVDEKLQTFPFKKNQYAKLFKKLGYSVKFIFLGNDFFNDDRYNDVFNYWKDHDIDKYIDKEIPLTAFKLDKPI